MHRRRLTEALFPGTFFEGDEGGGGGGGAAGGGTGGTGEGAGGGAGGTGGQGGTGDGGAGGAAGAGKTFDEGYVKQLRDENASFRKRAADAEKKLKEHDDAKLSETEKLQQAAKDAEEKLTAAQGRVRARLGKAEALTHSAALNLVDGDAAYKLIADQIEFNDEDEPTNVEALLKDLAKNKPWLVKTAAGEGTSTANPGGGTGRGGSGTPNKLTQSTVPGWGSVFKK